jgi:hypothetical protein
MTRTFYVNADWSAFVPEGSTSAAFGVSESDIDRLGLRDRLDAFLAPPAPPERAPEPEPPKQSKRPADKMLRGHDDK